MDTGKLILKTFSSLTGFLPRKDMIIFESSPNFADNTYWFYKYLVENTDVPEKYELVWFIGGSENAKDKLLGRKIKCFVKDPKTLKEKVDYTLYMTFAKYIIDCNTFVHKTSKKQKRVFLGHGMPMKIVKFYDLKKGQVDINTITTYLFNKHFYDIGDTDENMRNFGYCRTDVLQQHAGKRKNREKTSIVWMPTYRQHTRKSELRIENSFPLGLPVIKTQQQMQEIDDFLGENNCILYIRPHPAQDVSVMKIDEMKNIVIADSDYLDKRNLQLYEFLTETDALISDYSSVYYDYLMLERPIALAIEDLEDFSSKWPMFFDDFKANYKCPYLYTIDDLKKFISDTSKDIDEYEDERIKARDRFFDYTDGKTCERLYNYMVENFGL